MQNRICIYRGYRCPPAGVLRLRAASTGCLALVSICLYVSPASAQGVPQPSSVENAVVHDASESLNRRGTVTFRETPLTEVILILSEQWNVNIIAGSEINGAVNGAFKNETLKSILDSILVSNSLQFRQIGNSLVVLPLTDVGDVQSNFTVEVLDTRVKDVSEMTELISALKLQMSADGQLVPITSSGKLTIQDTPSRIAAVKALLAQISPSTTPPVYVSNNLPSANDAGQAGMNDSAVPAMLASVSRALELRPQYILASDLKEPLTMLVGAENLSEVVQENALVVFGDAAMQQRAQQLMYQLDKPRQQVRITGYIYDVDLGEMEKLGVDWGQRAMSTSIDANGVPNNMEVSGTGLLSPAALTNSANTLAGVVDTTAAAGAAAGAAATTTAAGPAGGQFLFRTLSSGFELQALIQALEQTKGSRLLADPHVTVVDRNKASLGIVTQIPVQQLTQTQQGGAIGSTTFKDAGITLDVTPRIANDGTIEMQVEPTFSVLAGFQNGNPLIDTRRASTVVRVNHGQALVIGGLRSKTTVETVKGIPGLMNVKYLGALFRVHDTDVRESELLVFIMPEIVGYCGGLQREMHALDVTQQQLSRISTAVDGPFTPDCKDSHCPQHQQRPRIHNGMYDSGLIGSHDIIFVNPTPTGIYQPQWAEPEAIQEVPQPIQVPSVGPAASDLRIVPTAIFGSPGAKPVSAQAESSSRRTVGRTAGYRR